MLDESISHFRVLSLFCHFYPIFIKWKIMLANDVDNDQTPHYVASDMGLHCLPGLHCLSMTLLQVYR